MEKLITLIEAAALAGVTDDTFRDLMRTGKGPQTVMVGKRQRIRPADWRAWVDSLGPSAPVPARPKARAVA
jgi:predicted DNA-binding transcriptional regulator AlpA